MWSFYSPDKTTLGIRNAPPHLKKKLGPVLLWWKKKTSREIQVSQQRAGFFVTAVKLPDDTHHENET